MTHKIPLFAAAFTGAAAATLWLAPENQTQAAPKTSSKATSKATPQPISLADFGRFQTAIRETANMVSDAKAQRLARRQGLQVLNLTWEDTGRYKGSSVGPNISDMTIQVGALHPKTEKLSVTAMPVIRFPNFSDKTADLSPRDFTLLVGNQAGRPLRRVSLADFLKKPTAFMSRPWTWKASKKSLWAARDEKVLVAAQACFLPVPKRGQAKFNPVLFNYQSTQNDPAVLTILATRQGTSMTIIDNTRDAFSTGSVWGQRLFHNQNGQRASLTGQRQSDFNAANKKSGNSKNPAVSAARQSGMNMVLLIQVPLKQKNVMRQNEMAMDSASATASSAAPMPSMRVRRRSDVENAVIGHGEMEGPFTETDNLEIERDPKFPVRVTVQFYKATSNGVVSPLDLKQISAQIRKIYAQSSAVGSLVTGGETGRITEYEGVKVQPAGWWQAFWTRRERETGKSRQQIIAELQKLLGAGYQARPVSELYLRRALKKSAK